MRLQFCTDVIKWNTSVEELNFTGTTIKMQSKMSKSLTREETECVCNRKTQMDMIYSFYWFITIENFTMDENNMKSTCPPNHCALNKSPSTQPLYKIFEFINIDRCTYKCKFKSKSLLILNCKSHGEHYQSLIHANEIENEIINENINTNMRLSVELLFDLVLSSNGENRNANVSNNMYYKPKSNHYFASMNGLLFIHSNLFPLYIKHNKIYKIIKQFAILYRICIYFHIFLMEYLLTLIVSHLTYVDYYCDCYHCNNLYINSDTIPWTNIGMQSPEYITILTNDKVKIIDETNKKILNNKICDASSAMMNPHNDDNIIKSTQLNDPALFWRWLGLYTIGFIVRTPAYHWIITMLSSKNKYKLPLKNTNSNVFARYINYSRSKNGNYLFVQRLTQSNCENGNDVMHSINNNIIKSTMGFANLNSIKNIAFFCYTLNNKLIINKIKPIINYTTTENNYKQKKTEQFVRITIHFGESFWMKRK